MTALNLDNLHSTHYLSTSVPGITPALGGYLREACIVCLRHSGHASGAPLSLQGNALPKKPFITLTWKTPPLPQNAPQAHADCQDATEDGAVAVAILLITEFTEYRIVARAPKGEGYDYFLRPKNAAPPDNDNFLAANRDAPNTYIHLEVSGILKQTKANTIQKRLRAKQKRFQTLGTQGKNLIVIVAFDQPAATVER